MKMASLIILFVVASSVLVNAQEMKPKKDNYPFWTISKDVQRQQFKNVVFFPAKITLADGASVASKDVHRKNIEKRNDSVATNGYPTWTISKGVAKQQAERNAKSK